MTEVNKICQNYNIQTGIIPQSSQNDINLANDLAEFLKALQLVERADQRISQVGKFSPAAGKTYQRNQIKVKIESDREEIATSPIEQVIRVLDKTIEDIDATPNMSAGTPLDRSKFDTLRTHYKNIQSALQQLYANCSGQEKKRFLDLWSATSGPSQVDRLKAALQDMVNSLIKKFPPGIAAKLELENISRGEYDPVITGLQAYIRENCNKYVYVKRQPLKPVLPKPGGTIKPAQEESWFIKNGGKLDIRLSGGYGNNVVRAGNIAGGGTAELKILENKTLRLDFDTIAAHDNGENAFVFDDNFVRTSLSGESYFVQLGFRSYRSDFPTFTRPTQNSVVVSAGKRFMSTDKLSMDFSTTGQFGAADYEQPSNSHFQARVLGSAGAAYKSKMFAFSLAAVGGGIFEQNEKQGLVGGKFNLRYDSGKFGFKFMSYGVYYPKSQSDSANIAGMLEGSWKITENNKLSLFLGPVEFTAGKDKNTTGLQGGLGYTWSWPNALSAEPKSIILEPLPYLMGSETW